jgi:hypothetical protein
MDSPKVSLDAPSPKIQNHTRHAIRRLGDFLTWCAGTVPEILRMYPAERAKYQGIGGAVLTTGVLAFFSGFYAIYTTLADGSYGLLWSLVFAVLWGLAIFNLDRYIVSSLRKPTDVSLTWRRRLAVTWLPALPRLGLAVLIGITLSKPLELRLFQSAISSQIEINRDRAVTAKRAGMPQTTRIAEINGEIEKLNGSMAAASENAKRLSDEFRREADGTGGSLRYGYSEVARVKEAAANQARQEADNVQRTLGPRVAELQAQADQINGDIDQRVESFRAGFAEDFLTRMTALSDLRANSPAVWWISAFVTLLLIAIEITPVLVKLISPIGAYDVKLDALYDVDTTEAFLKRDTANRIASYHYGLVEKAEQQGDDALLDIRAVLTGDELHKKTEAWKAARATGAAVTMNQLVEEVRREILTLRNP